MTKKEVSLAMTKRSRPSHLFRGGHAHEAKDFSKDNLTCLDQLESCPGEGVVLGDDPALLIEAVKHGGQILGIVRQVVRLESDCHLFYYFGEKYQAAD